jgi:hypothetical protein
MPATGAKKKRVMKAAPLKEAAVKEAFARPVSRRVTRGKQAAAAPASVGSSVSSPLTSVAERDVMAHIPREDHLEAELKILRGKCFKFIVHNLIIFFLFFFFSSSRFDEA